jgi:molybdenum cofactor cytidylyltransferase
MYTLKDNDRVNISAILLGAGESKRMGKDKLSLPWGEETVLEHCLRILLRSEVQEVILVISNLAQWKQNRYDNPKIKVVLNPRYREGMSSSIRKGLQALDRSSRGVLIALGDQPLLKTRTINRLIHAFALGKGKIVIPSFQRKMGHPVIFHRRYERELMRLKGDVGGKSIIERHAREVKRVRVRSEGVIKDIDTWKDYGRELKRRRTGRVE